jgi:hypothetical protein
MYKDTASKYGGTIKENFQDAFHKYLRVIDDLQIPSDRGLQVLHNMLTGEALRFCFRMRPFDWLISPTSVLSPCYIVDFVCPF